MHLNSYKKVLHFGASDDTRFADKGARTSDGGAISNENSNYHLRDNEYVVLYMLRRGANLFRQGGYSNSLVLLPGQTLASIFN